MFYKEFVKRHYVIHKFDTCEVKSTISDDIILSLMNSFQNQLSRRVATATYIVSACLLFLFSSGVELVEHQCIACLLACGRFPNDLPDT